MRAIWKGAVSFGLVSVPVKLYSATESHDISFRQVHAKDGGRIKYQRVCSIDGEEVAYADIAKGYETDDGEMVILDDDDLAELPANSSREISVEKFVPSDQIDPMHAGEVLLPRAREERRSSPTRCCATRSRRATGSRWSPSSLRTRMTPAVLRVRDDVLVHADDDVARRDPQARLRLAQGRRRGQAAGAEDGAAAPRHPGRRLRPDRVRGRLRRGGAGAGGGQARGRRGQAHQGAGAEGPARSSTCSRRCRSRVAAAKTARGEDPGDEPAVAARPRTTSDEAGDESRPPRSRRRRRQEEGRRSPKKTARRSRRRRRPPPRSRPRRRRRPRSPPETARQPGASRPCRAAAASRGSAGTTWWLTASLSRGATRLSTSADPTGRRCRRSAAGPPAPGPRSRPPAPGSARAARVEVGRPDHRRCAPGTAGRW